MIPCGYMAKRVSPRPRWLHAKQVVDVYSVSDCISNNFASYINDWKHNGYWFFDAAEIIQELAQTKSIDLSDTSLFYYEVLDLQFDEAQNAWTRFNPEPSFRTGIVVPSARNLAGYDVVTFSVGTLAECSPLSCNALAAEVATNQHCLLESIEEAQRLLENGRFSNSEPGPFRIFAVYRI